MRSSRYKAIADVYDLWYREEPEPFTVWLSRHLNPELKKASVMTDLACGTGTLAIAAAREGTKVYGVDVSPEMLRHAGAKARKEKVAVRWIESRMEQFSLPEPQDLVVCAFDSINHLLMPEALRRCFRCVSRALKPKGRFIFDVNNLRSFRVLWNHEEEQNFDGLRIHMRNRFELRTRYASCTLTIRPVRGRPQVQRIEERYYPRVELRSLLAKTGFQVERCEPIDPFPDLGLGPIKDLWYCRKT